MKNIVWKISSVEIVNDSQTFESRIDAVTWIVVGSNESHTVYKHGQCYLLAPDSLLYKQFLDVTEEDLVLWVKHALGQKEVIKIEDLVKAELDLRKNTDIDNSSLPWNSTIV